MAEKKRTPDLIREYLDRLKTQDRSRTVEEYSQRLTLFRQYGLPSPK